jgi:flagellar protein FliS
LKAVNPLNTYRETQIKTANQAKLIIMLYDGAIKHLNVAIEALNKKHQKYDVMNNSIIKAQDIISELMVSLDFEKGGDIAQNLFSLYIFMNRQLLDANVQKLIEPLEDVKGMLMELRAAWAAISKRNDLESESSSENGNGINIAG